MHLKEKTKNILKKISIINKGFLTACVTAIIAAGLTAASSASAGAEAVPATGTALSPATNTAVSGPAYDYDEFSVRKSYKLEKDGAFRLRVLGLKQYEDVERVQFQIFDGGEMVYHKVADSDDEGNYIAKIKLSKIGNKLKVFSVRASVRDLNGTDSYLPEDLTLDERIQTGKASVKCKLGDITYTYSGLYVPGFAKQVIFKSYMDNDGSLKKFAETTVEQKNFKDITAVSPIKTYGKAVVKIYAVTRWGKKKFIGQKNFKIRKTDLGLNGWHYSTYNGHKYKFFYVNNKKLTDVTSKLGLKRNMSNHFVFEVNRAAATVTAYAYDSNTGSYDIPVRAFRVSVGRDTWSKGTVADTDEDTSFTPLGTYATGQRYSCKPMVEPDDSICYARWATHVCGNVYFHSIAVGADSHYALSPSDFNRLGGPASAGCMRMMVRDAKWIYDYASSGCQVKISFGSASAPGPLGKPAGITSEVNYDPTDPEVPDSKKIADYKAGRISGYILANGRKVGC
ncbi:MAG: L,D-transpeptidase [Lachnospiraceae bacterium]|jgi:lipoprotein-anchoring transpeptidase ErfK/SrfK|nr:L,D-transpeptidase [Lachnospiraceae bacterium]MEE3461022.1 L,D-transpeptidase [Lachnospiraceae bacterium]